MKKRFLAGLLALLMLLTMLPVSALAAQEVPEAEIEDRGQKPKPDPDPDPNPGGSVQTSTLTFRIEGGTWNTDNTYGGVLQNGNTELVFTLTYNASVGGYVYTCKDNSRDPTAEDFINALVNVVNCYQANPGYGEPGTWSVLSGGTVYKGEATFPNDAEAQMNHVRNNPHKYDNKMPEQDCRGFAANTVYLYKLMPTTFTVTFDAGDHGTLTDGTKVVSGEYLSGASYPTPPALTAEEHFEFIGWYQGDTKVETFPATVTADAYYVAHWKQVSTDPTPVEPVAAAYKVEHYKENVNGEYELAETEFPLYGEIGTVVTAEAKTYPHYTENTTHADRVPSGEVITPSVDEDGIVTILTLKLYYKLNRYTVTFVDEDGKTVLKEATEYPYGTKKEDIVQPETPTKEADDQFTYAFAGWTPDLEDVTENVVYRATYTKTVRGNAYMVEYYYDGVLDAAATEILTADYGTEITEYPDKVRTGFTLDYVENLPLTVGAGENVIKVYYAKDVWNDAKDKDDEGDGIPDKYQVLVYYVSENETKGTVAPAMEVITLDPLPAGGYRTKGDIVIQGAKATPKTGWLFVEWTVAPVLAFTGADDALLPRQVLKDVDGGSVITFTAWFKAENAVLDITKTLDNKNKDYVEVGDTLEYTIRIKNTGNVDLEDISVYDVLRDDNGKKIENLDLYRKDIAGGKVVYTKVTKIDIKAGEVIYLYAFYEVQSKDLGKRLINYVYALDENGKELGQDHTDSIKVVCGLFLPVLNTTDHVAYVIGYEDSTVRPNNNITRAEVATIFFRLLTDESRAYYWSKTNDYSDVSPEAWYNNAVSTMSNAGVITGYPDGTFQPDAPITRAEFAAIAARFSDWVAADRSKFSDVSSSHWASKYIALAEALGWINGYPDGTFRPNRNITRAESMTLINRVLERAVESEYYMLPNMVTWSDNHPSDWFYEDVQEATNTHTYHRSRNLVPGKTFYYEIWDTIEKNPDWAALEKTWSKSNSK